MARVQEAPCGTFLCNHTSFFFLVARPAFAEEVKASDTNAKTEVVAPAIENVVATVETKTLDENPTATHNRCTNRHKHYQ